ncbi:MAG: prepilin peptidase [Flavobacteriaceae bacterium]
MTALSLLLMFQAAMILAAFCDLFTMTIPNRLTAGFALLFVVVALLSGMGWGAVGMHAVVGLAALALGFGLFSAGWIGGGDAKFFAATALWIGPQLILEYTLWASLAGGLLTVGLVLARQMPLPSGLAEHAWLARLHKADTGIPYGVALALAGLVIASRAPWAAGII